MYYTNLMTNLKLTDFTFDTSALMQTVFLLFLALVLRFIACKFVDVFFDKFRHIGSRANAHRMLAARVNTLKTLVKNIVSLGIYGMIVISILDRWGVSVMPILTGAGIAGIAVAFGSQKLVNDVVTGFFLLLENQYNVGDRILAAGIEGKVVAINLRTTVLEGDDGTLNYLPNSSISVVSKRIENEQKKPT